MMRPWRTTRWNVRYAPVDDPALALIWQERIAWYPTPGRPPRRPRWWPLTLLVLAAIVLAALQAHPSIGHAQATNGNLKLLQEGLTSAGGAGSAATGRLTGVGPSIASGSQTYNGNCADFPQAPMNSSRHAIVNIPN